MADWVTDKGLDRLRAQVDAAAPGRSKASDGTVGDPAHQLRQSDHNPESPPPPGNPDNEVDAEDFTHDPAHGADMNVMAEALRKSQDRRISYAIWNRRIFSSYSTSTRKAWEWGSYSGTDPHTNHLHISVNDIHHDETQDWQIGIDMSDSAGAIASFYRQLSVLMLDAAIAADAHVTPTGRLAKVPLIELLNRLDKATATILASVTDAGPVEVTLSTDQLGQLADLVVARLGALRFEGHS